MPRNSFFKELRPRKVCLNCRVGFHEGCSPEVLVSKQDEWPADRNPALGTRLVNQVGAESGFDSEAAGFQFRQQFIGLAGTIERESEGAGDQGMSVRKLPEATAGRWGQGLTAAKMKECVWVEPETVGQFEFLEWTGASHVRHIKFVGLRHDKDKK
jgi:hypothetical protein